MEENKDYSAKLFGSLNYAGKVSIDIINKDKDKLFSKTFHNEGKPNLFRFFANCLLGNWTIVKDQLPCKIILFDQANGETPVDTKISFSKTLAMSPAVRYDTAGYAEPIKDDSSNIIGYKTTLHFRIPFTYISSNGKICKIGLYPNNISDYDNELCASFLLVDETGNNWDPVEVPSNANNFTIIVNWELQILDAELYKKNN